MLKKNNKKNEQTSLTTGNEKKPNAWKRYGALLMAGVLLAGTAAQSGVFHTAGTAQAEEQETEKEVRLSIAGSDDEASADEAETEAEEAGTETEAETETETETETEQKETFAQIESVNVKDAAVVTTDVSAVVENCMPSIVSITMKSVEEVETYFYGRQEYEATGSASGIIIAQNDDELLIATNSHVVADATELSVSFTAEAEKPEDLIVPAKVKGTDKSYELAVVAVALSDIPDDVRDQLKIATLGSSDDLKVGQAAIAIGNALGYGQSVTSGIISALNREITIDNFSNEVILTDAAINLGNSGGALLNNKGQVIGINVAKESGTVVDSMGYSIPIDTAIPVLQRLVNKETRDKMGNSERGYLGATVVDVSADAKELYNMPAGAFVYDLEGDSAAAEAGIRKGDVITKFDGESVTDKEDLIEKMGYYAVGETVTVEIQRATDGEYIAQEVEVTLREGSAAAVESQEPQDDQKEQPENDGSDTPDDYEDYQFDDGFGDYNGQWSFPFGNGMF